MFKTILVPVNGGVEQDRLVIAAGLRVARLFDAHLRCVRASMTTAAMLWQSELVEVGPAIFSSEFRKTLAARAAARTKMARDAFDELCAAEGIPLREAPLRSNGVSASWLEIQGNQVERILSETRLHDLTVVTRGSLEETDPAAYLVGSVLLRSGRPLLLVRDPLAPGFNHTVAIAWKDSPEAARAVAAATPLLMKADKVLVLCADEGDRASHRHVESARELCANLRWHDIATEAHIIAPTRSAMAQTVVQRARELNAGLLVMGGYGRRPAEEFIFGGFTRDVLDGCSLAVLMAH